MTLSWLKDGKDIGASSNVFVDTKRGLSTILIELVDISNAGNYTCIAKNRAGFDSLTAYLDVQAAPSWKRKSDDVRVNIGDRAVVECVPTGSPKPTTTWKKQSAGSKNTWNSGDIPLSTTVYDNGTLVIEEVSISDAGRYICEADNGIPPAATHAFSVMVNGETNGPLLSGLQSKSAVHVQVSDMHNNTKRDHFLRSPSTIHRTTQSRNRKRNLRPTLTFAVGQHVCQGLQSKTFLFTLPPTLPQSSKNTRTAAIQAMADISQFSASAI